MEEERKKKAILIACVFGAVFLLILLLPILFNFVFYKNIKNKIIEQTPTIKNNQDNSNCVGYKTFTKYNEDNTNLYNKCLNQEDDDPFAIPDYSDDFKVYYSTDEMNIGFLKADDLHGYLPRDYLSVFNEKDYDFVTNKDGDDLVTFGRIYADIYGDNIMNFLWVYTDIFNYETCVSKEFLMELSNQIYGNSTAFVSELFSDEDPYYHSENMYCFAVTGFGPGEDFEYDSQNKNGNKRTIKYKNVSGLDTTGKRYATIDFELKDGYWTVQSFKLSDN